MNSKLSLLIALGVLAGSIGLLSQSAFAQNDKADRAKKSKQIETTMTIDLLDRIDVSSPVEGVIKTISGRVGTPTIKGELLVQLDTERRVMELSASENEYRALKIKSENNSREKTGEARERSARVNLQKLQEVTTRYQVSVPALEMTRAESQLKEATFEKLGARKESSQFQYEARASFDQMKLLKFDLNKSSIEAKYDGTIARIEKHPGEFVQAGETIAELYRMDRLSGVVLINRDQLAPEEAIGVTGQLQIKNKDQKSSYEISIVRILPRLDVDGKYRAFVEFDNEKSSAGNWRLLPGMTGKATFSPDKRGEAEPAKRKSTSRNLDNRT